MTSSLTVYSCFVFVFVVIKYNFSKLDDSGNCIIRKTCCIAFDLK